MARRKPTQVQRNRQQEQLQRELDETRDGAPDAVDGDASNGGPQVIVIDDSSENDDVEVDDSDSDSRPLKRQRGRGPWNSRCHSWAHEEAAFSVNQPTQLHWDHAPWSAKKRVEALWLAVSIESQPLLAGKLRELEAKGSLTDVKTIGFGLAEGDDDDDEDEDDSESMDEDDGDSPKSEEKEEASPLLMRELCQDLGMEFEILVREDLVTMELQRTSDESLGFVWRFGVDWRSYVALTANKPMESPKLKSFPASSMRQLMAWLLYQNNRLEGSQRRWTYPFPEEFAAFADWTECSTAFDIHQIYAKIDVQRQLQRDLSNIPVSITSTGGALLPTLRDYQKAALSWMLSREGVGRSTNPDPRRLTRCVRFPLDGGELLFDLFCGRFSEATGDNDVDEPLATDLSAVRGGILADEMGLGKTVEVISLVLSHPSPVTASQILQQPVTSENATYRALERNCICGTTEDCDPGWVQCELCNYWHHQLCTGYDPTISDTQGKFICFQCQVDQHLTVSCKTTLIVSPEAIHDQWESELKRHVKPGVLTLLRYPGVKAMRTRLQDKGPSADWRVLASCGAKMASYDIVLTTYEALASDLHYLPTSMGRERRSSTRQKRKKYVFVASPLVFLKFWRVCMDEAQVGVENIHLQAAVTVSELRAEMQWIVTGTPFSTQLSDLYGCFKFLRVAPFSDDDWGLLHFREQIERCFSNGAVGRVLDLLLLDASSSRAGGGLLWRTNKKDVLAQLGLPEQTQELVWCRFSDVERLFYSQREKEVIKALKEEQERRRREQGLAKGEDDEVGDAVWHRLLMLRQVCCHPQVGQIMQSIGASARSLGRGGVNRRGRGRGTNGDIGMQAGAMNILTMDDFLQQLLEKCRRECEEAQRKLIGAHNGHASLSLIGEDYASAIIKYMVSVNLIRTNWDDFRADLLPRLHILDNLANSVRRAFQLESEADENRRSTNGDDVVVVGDGDLEPDTSNPKQVSLMPELTHLRKAITEDGLMTEGVDKEAIRQECVALEAAADKIRRFYLQEIEMKHTSAKYQYESIKDTTEKSLCHAQTGRDEHDAMLCSPSLWWLEMLGLLKRLEPNDVQTIVDRLRAHLLAVNTKWSKTFVDRFHDVNGLSLALVGEMVELHKKRHGITTKLLGMSHSKPKKSDVEMSGNCNKCRDSREGPTCWHCQFYKELEGYKQHMLGIDSTVAPLASSSLASWIADDLIDLDDDSDSEGGRRIIEVVTTTTPTSLFLDIFRQLSTGTRALMRENRSVFGSKEIERWTSVIQDGLQQESELYTQLLREWNRATKLFQAQHHRLGALDELEMAQMKIRLRLPGEVVVTATDKLYKLQTYELPLKEMALEADRVNGEDELKRKQSELRYLKHLKETSVPKATGEDGENGAEDDGATRGDDRTCVVCLEDISKQRVTMLPCAHKTCVKCADRLANRSSVSKTIRCPTCRRVFPSEARKNVENDVGRAKELSLAARTQATASDKDVPLLRSGFSSKIDVILRRVRTLATKNPELKALIFTQWPDMMGVLAAALQLNGIKCFTFTTKKQFPHMMQQFKLFPSACVLALPFKVGANGLNVVEATEVLLVEPLLNTSIEAQAINRIHRIGQTKATRVHRFIVDKSVEEGIYWLGQNRQQLRVGTDADGDEEMKEGEVDDSLVLGRQEKEKVTIGQLQALLQGRTTNSANEDVGEGDLVGMEVPLGGDHPFWQQHVLVDEREMSRREARGLLERRRAAERRQAATSSGSASSEPVTLLVDRDVALTIAHELLQMKEVDGSATSESTANTGLAELIHMARQRVGEELRVWASQADAS